MKLAPLLAIFAAVWCGAQAPAPILSANPPMEALSLADAKREAVTNSPTLAALRARVSAASAVWRQARASQAPTLSASYAASRLQHQPTGGFSTGGPESATSLALDLEYLLYDGGARKHQISATEHDHLAEELSLQEGLRGLRFAVARAYLGILLAEARGQVAHAEQEINAIFLRDVEVRAKLGQWFLERTIAREPLQPSALPPWRRRWSFPESSRLFQRADTLIPVSILRFE